MRAAVLEKPRSIRIAHVPVPQPSPGQALVRVEGCGLCGSDLAVWQGREWFGYPRPAGAPGHETWGTVVAVADGANEPQVGTRVASLAADGFAEFAVADVGTAVPLPAHAGAFPGEAVACAMNAFARSGVTSGSTVAVVGVGFLGALLVQLSAAAGAHVVAVSRRGFALDVARHCGAKHVVSLDDDPAGAVGDVTGGNGCDVAIEVAGAQRTLDVAAALVRVRGRLVVAGYHQDGPRTVDLQSWNWRGLDVVNAHERDPAVYTAGIRRAVRAVEDGTVDVGALVTHEIALDSITRAFDLAERRPDGFLKAVVVP